MGQGSLANAVSWGDALPVWSLAAFTALDKPTRAAARTVNSSTPLASKFLNDGAYLRAMFGTFWLALPIMALVISLAGLGVTGG